MLRGIVGAVVTAVLLLSPSPLAVADPTDSPKTGADTSTVTDTTSATDTTSVADTTLVPAEGDTATMPSPTPTPTPTVIPKPEDEDRWVELALIVGGCLLGAMVFLLLIGSLLRLRIRQRRYR